MGLGLKDAEIFGSRCVRPWDSSPLLQVSGQPLFGVLQPTFVVCSDQLFLAVSEDLISTSYLALVLTGHSFCIIDIGCKLAGLSRSVVKLSSFGYSFLEGLSQLSLPMSRAIGRAILSSLSDARYPKIRLPEGSFSAYNVGAGRVCAL